MEALKDRVERAGWEYAHGSAKVVYVNDVLDWLDELAQLTSRTNLLRFRGNVMKKRSSKKSAKRGGRKPQHIARTPWFGDEGDTKKSPSVVTTTSTDRSMASGAMPLIGAYDL